MGKISAGLVLIGECAQDLARAGCAIRYRDTGAWSRWVVATRSAATYSLPQVSAAVLVMKLSRTAASDDVSSRGPYRCLSA